jgi:hypothetical protein
VKDFNEMFRVDIIINFLLNLAYIQSKVLFLVLIDMLPCKFDFILFTTIAISEYIQYILNFMILIKESAQNRIILYNSFKMKEQTTKD